MLIFCFFATVATGDRRLMSTECRLRCWFTVTTAAVDVCRSARNASWRRSSPSGPSAPRTSGSATWTPPRERCTSCGRLNAPMRNCLVRGWQPSVTQSASSGTSSTLDHAAAVRGPCRPTVTTDEPRRLWAALAADWIEWIRHRLTTTNAPALGLWCPHVVDEILLSASYPVDIQSVSR